MKNSAFPLADVAYNLTSYRYFIFNYNCRFDGTSVKIFNINEL